MAKEQSLDRKEVRRVLGRFWTIPNVLSIIRLILILPITYLILVDGSMAWLIGLILVAVLTDWLDGVVARWSRTVSSWGKVLDPLADKFGAAMIVTALAFRTAEPTIPLWFLALIIVRDSSIVLGGVLLARKTGHVATSTWAGKIAVSVLALAILAGVLRADQIIMDVLVWTTAALLVVSFLIYAVRFVRLYRSGEAADVEEDPYMEPLEAADGQQQQAGEVRSRDETAQEEAGSVSSQSASK